MKKLFIFALAGLFILVAIAIGVNLQHRRTIKRQLLITEASIATVSDYSESAGIAQADLAARSHLDALFVENLNPQEAKAAVALRDLLSAYEGIFSSHTIETTRDIVKKADEAMAPFHK